MTRDELAFLPLAQLGELLRSRAVSPVEVTQLYLDRIERIDGQLHSYITVCQDEALAAARQAQDDIGLGKYRGPLHGVPYATKDQMYTRGIRTTGASRVFKDFVPDCNATVIEKMSDAGAVLLGKLNLSEFALGGTREFYYGTPRNPWNTDYTPGESSSGSGIAVASGLCCVALGEDTGGSVRYPASNCGIVGLRPTTGRVSRYGLMPLSWSMDTAGPMGRTVHDVALLLEVIAGFDPKDPTSVDIPVPRYSSSLGKSVKGLRIGCIRELLEGEACHPDVRTAINNAIDVLRDIGASVEEVSVPLVSYVAQMLACVLEVDLAGAMEHIVRTRGDEIDNQSRTRCLAGMLAPAYVYQRGLKARNALARQLREKLKEFDVLVSPTMPDPPRTIASFEPRFASEANVVERMYRLRSVMGTYPLARLPAISVPCGFSSGGLPIGLQIGGRPFDESTLIQVAHAFESVTDYHLKRPPVS